MKKYDTAIFFLLAVLAFSVSTGFVFASEGNGDDRYDDDSKENYKEKRENYREECKEYRIQNLYKWRRMCWRQRIERQENNTDKNEKNTDQTNREVLKTINR